MKFKRLITNLIIIAALGGLLFIYAAWFRWVIQFGGDDSDLMAFVGTFGDSFGVLNALFSGIALIAIAISIMQAQHEIRLQKQELETQNRHLETQAFQNQFFQMLRSWQDMIELVTYQWQGKGEIWTGRGAFDKIATALKCVFESKDTGPGSVRTEFITAASGNQYRAGHIELNQYFRLLYHIVRFVHDNKDLDYNSKMPYIRILRAHLSEAEYIVLFYNLMTPAADKMVGMARWYKMLHNMAYSPQHTEDQEFLEKMLASTHPYGNRNGI